LGGGVIVGPGVTIGDGTVVGAGSVVVRSLPAGVIAAGNPARVMRGG
jgi:maltose O-acetyltransferase